MGFDYILNEFVQYRHLIASSRPLCGEGCRRVLISSLARMDSWILTNYNQSLITENCTALLINAFDDARYIADLETDPWNSCVVCTIQVQSKARELLLAQARD